MPLRILLLGMLPLLLAVAATADPPERPNFVVVVFDDLGYADVGAYGSTFVQTPTMDRLAAEGARFTRFYANAPSCSPSRAAFLTGKYPGSVGLRTNIMTSSQRSLPVEVHERALAQPVGFQPVDDPRAAYGSVVGDPLYDPVVDLDRNGSVNRVDVSSLMIAFGEPPGPSGVACGGTALCYRP